MALRISTGREPTYPAGASGDPAQSVLHAPDTRRRQHMRCRRACTRRREVRADKAVQTLPIRSITVHMCCRKSQDAGKWSTAVVQKDHAKEPGERETGFSGVPTERLRWSAGRPSRPAGGKGAGGPARQSRRGLPRRASRRMPDRSGGQSVAVAVRVPRRLSAALLRIVLPVLAVGWAATGQLAERVGGVVVSGTGSRSLLMSPSLLAARSLSCRPVRSSGWLGSGCTGSLLTAQLAASPPSCRRCTVGVGVAVAVPARRRRSVLPAGP
jgi:hypothetical protein